MCLVKQNAHWENSLDIKLKKNTTTPVHFSGVNHNITHLRVMPVELITQLTERKVRGNTDPSLARAIPQCFRGELLMIKHCTAVWVISTLDCISHKWLHTSEIRSKTTATHRVHMRKMSNRWGHRTYPRHNRQCYPHPGSAFTSEPQSIATHWPVLSSCPAEGRRPSWPGWLGEILRWFGHPKMVTNSSTSGGSWESNLRASSRESSALTRRPSHFYEAVLAAIFHVRNLTTFLSASPRTISFHCSSPQILSPYTDMWQLYGKTSTVPTVVELRIV